MRELLRSNDPVRLSWLQALLADEHIGAIILDAQTAILEGGAGAIRRRLMVIDEDYIRSRRILADAGELPLSDDGPGG